MSMAQTKQIPYWPRPPGHHPDRRILHYLPHQQLRHLTYTVTIFIDCYMYACGPVPCFNRSASGCAQNCLQLVAPTAIAYQYQQATACHYQKVTMLELLMDAPTDVARPQSRNV